MNIVYCNECGNLEKRKSGSGYRYYCSKEDKYFPINYTEKDIEENYCVNGKAPRKEYNTRCGDNTW